MLATMFIRSLYLAAILIFGIIAAEEINDGSWEQLSPLQKNKKRCIFPSVHENSGFRSAALPNLYNIFLENLPKSKLKQKPAKFNKPLLINGQGRNFAQNTPIFSQYLPPISYDQTTEFYEPKLNENQYINTRPQNLPPLIRELIRNTELKMEIPNNYPIADENSSFNSEEQNNQNLQFNSQDQISNNPRINSEMQNGDNSRMNSEMQNNENFPLNIQEQISDNPRISSEMPYYDNPRMNTEMQNGDNPRMNSEMKNNENLPLNIQEQISDNPRISSEMPYYDNPRINTEMQNSDNPRMNSEMQNNENLPLNSQEQINENPEMNSEMPNYDNSRMNSEMQNNENLPLNMQEQINDNSRINSEMPNYENSRMNSEMQNNDNSRMNSEMQNNDNSRMNSEMQTNDNLDYDFIDGQYVRFDGILRNQNGNTDMVRMMDNEGVITKTQMRNDETPKMETSTEPNVQSPELPTTRNQPCKPCSLPHVTYYIQNPIFYPTHLNPYHHTQGNIGDPGFVRVWFKK